MPQEEPQRPAVEREHAMLDAAERALHPGFLRACAALAEQPRTHQRRQRQRNDAAGEDRDDDRDRELAEDAPDQTRS